MSKHIGIVACSAEGAALCYRTICQEGQATAGRHNHPEITMHTYALAEYERYFEAGDWSGVAGLMVSSAEKVAGAGADFAICPDNTVHEAFDDVVQRSPIPWLHIAEEVASEAVRLGFRRLAVLGTRLLMEGPVYPSRLAPAGLDHAIPEPADRERMNEVIFDELVNARFTDESRRYFAEVIERLKEQGCDAVVLGCTELPLLVTPESSPLPTLDSTGILARAALRRAMDGEAAK
ncbi:MAG: amino acid racemase [Dehalococcoidia bacterium]|nr:amino acid racemase [Dehalococcoidia bacterium]